MSEGVWSISHSVKAITKHVNIATQGIFPLLIMAAFWLVKENVAGIKLSVFVEVLYFGWCARKYKEMQPPQVFLVRLVCL